MAKHWLIFNLKNNLNILDNLLFSKYFKFGFPRLYDLYEVRDV